MDNRWLLSKGRFVIVIFIVCFTFGLSSHTIYAADQSYKSNGQVDFYGTYEPENGKEQSKDQHNQTDQQGEKAPQSNRSNQDNQANGANPANPVLPKAGDKTESIYLVVGWGFIFISIIFLMIFKVSKQKRRNEHEIFES
ncbi:hypothetical protein AKG37_15195 [Bacillus australimaris]|uniref:Gram-positive cocci surface proteins LPxTG domain-containing protein n=1 Tax=Bacillus australimaris TaxID=1326968 RepID=A0ABD4QMF9_9BACI|nr:hypothetical protein [Bacillus australimaris]KPN12691.1 hypothetical protein AKG37_15195 [Bacillus australimaris]MBR8691633.1 hypothetical protein [Bacillus australimaris]